MEKLSPGAGADFKFTNITGNINDKGGVLPARSIGRTRWDSVPGMAETSWGRQHIACLAAHAPFSNLEYAAPYDTGETRWYCVSGEPTFSEDGVFTCST